MEDQCNMHEIHEPRNVVETVFGTTIYMEECRFELRANTRVNKQDIEVFNIQ